MHLTLDSGDASKLLGDDERLQSTTRIGSRVGVIAAAGAARSGDGTARVHPVRGRRQDLDGIGSTERSASVLGHPGHHPLTGQPMTNEHDSAFVASHAEPTVSRRTELDLEQKAEPTLGHFPAGGS